MIPLKKPEINKVESLERKLEKLQEMKLIMMSNKSTVNLDYSINLLNERIKDIQNKIIEKDLVKQFESEDKTIFDTEEYAKKVKEQ